MATFTYPTVATTIPGVATEAKQDVMIANQVLEIAELTDINTELDSQTTLLTSLDGKDYATETTLAALAAEDFATETTLASIAAEDFATETTLASLEAKDFATSAKQDTIITSLSNIETSTAASLSPVDFLDVGVLDSSSTNIPAAGVSVVASLASDCKELEIVDDIGEYMTLTDGSDNVLAYLPLGGGRVKVSIASGTAVKLASVSGATITAGNIAMNFLG